MLVTHTYMPVINLHKKKLVARLILTTISISTGKEKFGLAGGGSGDGVKVSKDLRDTFGHFHMADVLADAGASALPELLDRSRQPDGSSTSII